MGAGRGMLGLALRCLQPRSPLLLVERSGVRRKADKLLRRMNGGGLFERIRIDLRHFALWRHPWLAEKSATSASVTTKSFGGEEANSSDNATSDNVPPTFESCVVSTDSAPPSTARKRPAVVFAKHLCGVATDYAIRSLLHGYDGCTGTM